MQPCVWRTSHHVGAGHPCRGYFQGFAHLEGVLRGRKRARVAAGGAGVDGERDAVARPILQPELLADVEEGSSVAYAGPVGIVFYPYGGHRQCQVFQPVPLFPEEAACRFLIHSPALDVLIGRVVDAGYQGEAGLLGDAGFELVGYPADVGRVDIQNLVQEVAAVFAEGNQVLAFALHAFGVVFHEKQAAGGVEAKGAGHAQGFVDVGREVAEVEDGLPAGQRRINPKGVQGFAFARKHEQVGTGLFVGGSSPVVLVEFLVQQGLFVVGEMRKFQLCHGCQFICCPR